MLTLYCLVPLIVIKIKSSKFDTLIHAPEHHDGITQTISDLISADESRLAAVVNKKVTVPKPNKQLEEKIF